MKMFFVVDLDDTLVNTTKNLQGDPGKVSLITLVIGAREFLEKHGQEAILVSVGHPPYQREKLRLLGITSLFRGIEVVVNAARKAQTIARLASQAALVSRSVVVIGDRLDQDILPGNLSGCTTVRMRLPEGKYSRFEPKPEEVPDYTVGNFQELMQLPIFSEVEP